MKPFTSALAFLAVLAALGAILFFVLDRDGPKPVEIEEALPERAGPAPLSTRRMEIPKGGVFAGRVVDRDGRGVGGARVLLVAFDAAGLGESQPAMLDPESYDPSQVPVVGFRTAAETTADPGGRFRVAADPDSAIRVVCAWHVGHVPRLVGVEGPTEGMEITLAPAGRFVGHVVDAETGRPVPRANVAIYLQQRVDPLQGEVGSTVRGRPAGAPRSFFALAQRWVAKELGPRVWGTEWAGDESIRVWTDPGGDFSFGPIGDEVQLEFVITHASYLWTEHDQKAGGTIQRTVVRPGETVERTFRLQRGKSISGRVIDENNRGVADVLVSVDSVAQYKQHWWYRIKPRRARTRRDGSFQVGGLSFGPYTVTLEHPASGRTVIPGVPAGATDLALGVKMRGAIQGTVQGLEPGPFGERGTLVLEALGEVGNRSQHVRERVVLDEQRRFLLRGVEPGRWNAWLQVGGTTSQPQEIEVPSLATTDVVFELGGGGGLTLRVWEVGDREVDPAMVSLVSLASEGTERPMGRFVTRGGRLDAADLAPGRYRVEVSAPGYLTASSEPFDVTQDRVTDVGDVLLRRPGTIRVADVLDPAGRPATIAVHLTVREGEGPARPLNFRLRPEVQVEPGLVTLRAESDDGGVFEETYEVLDGQVLPVTIRLGRP